MKYIKCGNERSFEQEKETKKIVEDIINKIRLEKDAALWELSKKFDEIKRESFHITQKEIKEAYNLVDSKIINAIEKAHENIKNFALLQKESQKTISETEISKGVYLSHNIVPIDSCMCYVPAGRYPLFSTALMLITPAKVAGVKRIAATSPVIKGTDKVNPIVLVAMDIAGADEITAIGGAQAIAAYAYGTESIKEVNIITGPGNKFVTEAKRQCYGKVGIDFTAGPSEVLVIGDESCNPKVAAADLIAQSEHDVLAKGIMISTSEKLLLEVAKEVEEQLKRLSTENIARKSWEDNGTLIYCESLEEAAKISDETAPEHLEIMVKNPNEVERLVKNYGSLFIGQYSAEVFGDYSSGTNHTLPTMGGAKYTGGVWVGTYTKTLTRQRLSKEGFSERSEITKEMARAEGLFGHENAVIQREINL